MAQISYGDIPENTGAGNPAGGNNVEFFNLRNDGDEVIVRILHDDTSSFNIFTVHDRVTVGGKIRKVNCIRDPKDPVDNCPLCAAGQGIINRIFINMVQYNVDPSTNTVTAKPVVWERSLNYATRLKNLIDEYGPLSDCIFKIKRNGAAGSMDTTYDIFYCNPKVYRDDLYPKDTSAFASYSALGTIILNKNYQDLQTFVTTGSFPVAQNDVQNSGMQYPANPANVPVTNVVPPMSYQPKPAMVNEVASSAAPTAPAAYTAPPVELPTAPPVNPAPYAAPAVPNMQVPYPNVPGQVPAANTAAPGRPTRYY